MYDKTPTRHYLGARDFGTSASILTYIKGPKGKKGFLWDYGICNIVETFAGTTLHPGMQVGTTDDEDAYGDLIRFTAAADDDGIISLRTLYDPTDAAFKSLMVNTEIPADTVVMVTIEEGTGGSEAGQATPFVDIIWYD